MLFFQVVAPMSCLAIGSTVRHSVLYLQIRDLNSGTFGFVQLAKDKQTGELIACKFIERGEKVGMGLNDGFQLRFAGPRAPMRRHRRTIGCARCMQIPSYCCCCSLQHKSRTHAKSVHCVPFCRSPSTWSVRS